MDALLQINDVTKRFQGRDIPHLWFLAVLEEARRLYLCVGVVGLARESRWM